MNIANPFRRFQFSLKDLFLAMTLIAVGIGLMVAVHDNATSLNVRGLTWPLAFSSFILIGAGIGAPFHRKLAGGVVAAALALLVWIAEAKG